MKLWDFVDINGVLLFRCVRCGHIVQVNRPFTRKMYDAMVCGNCKHISVV